MKTVLRGKRRVQRVKAHDRRGRNHRWLVMPPTGVRVRRYQRRQPEQTLLLTCWECGLNFFHAQMPGPAKRRCPNCEADHVRRLARDRKRRQRDRSRED